ncbi:sensor histidine kinase [Flavobacterium wongokense]|uniref:sensor histidine kinase n=1 Tax=Flavobacterium wongokense TaxID=2910674 RepID=UPI001F480AE6|nr:HAMP domain-containing sensor histidine kinase [Flavobacterium sp. WG47]MCF6131130.1 HAMP domain-containing histidine kinase [Flavobacterium sp. WG47]
MRKYVLLLLLCFSLSNAQNLKIEKIERLKRETTQSASALEKINKEIEISTTYRYYNLDSTYYFASQALHQSRKKGYKKEEAKALTCLVIYCIEKNKSQEALALNKVSLKTNISINNKKGIGFNYALLGRIYQLQSDFVNASKYYFKAEKIAANSKDEETKMWIYKNLSFLFLDQQNFAKALDFGYKSKAITLKMKDYEETAFCNGVLGEVYRVKKDFANSEKYFTESHAYFKKHNNYYGIAWVLTNWSILYQADLKKCAAMEFEAQEIWDKISPNNVMSMANQYNIGYTYFDMYTQWANAVGKHNLQSKELLTAEKYFIKTMDLAKANKNKNWEMYCYSTLSSVEYIKNNIRGYGQYVANYNQLKDSIFSQKNKNKIAELEVAKTIDLKNKEIQLNKMMLATKEKQKWYLIGGILSLFIIGSLLFYQSRSRKRNNEKLQLLNAELDEANKTKTRFFSILNHDLRGPVSNLVFFLQLQKESPEMLDEESKKRMQDKTMSGAENLLASMEDILQWSKSQMENFKPQPKKVFISSLFEDTKSHFLSEEKIKISFENPENLQLTTDENYLKTIIRNLTGNAIKALNEVDNPTVTWKAWKENDKTYLSVTDNGSGASKDQFKALYDDKEVVGIKSGLGLHLIRDLAKAIDCRIEVETKLKLGTTITLILK